MLLNGKSNTDKELKKEFDCLLSFQTALPTSVITGSGLRRVFHDTRHGPRTGGRENNLHQPPRYILYNNQWLLIFCPVSFVLGRAPYEEMTAAKTEGEKGGERERARACAQARRPQDPAAGPKPPAPRAPGGVRLYCRPGSDEELQTAAGGFLPFYRHRPRDRLAAGSGNGCQRVQLDCTIKHFLADCCSRCSLARAAATDTYPLPRIPPSCRRRRTSQCHPLRSSSTGYIPSEMIYFESETSSRAGSLPRSEHATQCRSSIAGTSQPCANG